MSDDADKSPNVPQLGAIGLDNFEPYLMNRIMGRYNASLRDEVSGLGLTTAKMRALAVLSVLNGPLIRDLSVYAVVEQSTLSRALDALETDGLIRRETDEADTRASRIFLTDAGRAAFDQLWPSMSQARDRMFQNIAPDDRAVFVKTLKQVLVNIRKHDL